MDGPPFSVADTEVEQHFADGWTLHKVEEKDVLTGNPRFIDSGLTAVDEHVFRLIRR
jgi:thiopurine S-methyltransferase